MLLLSCPSLWQKLKIVTEKHTEFFARRFKAMLTIQDQILAVKLPLRPTYINQPTRIWHEIMQNSVTDFLKYSFFWLKGGGALLTLFPSPYWVHSTPLWIKGQHCGQSLFIITDTSLCFMGFCSVYLVFPQITMCWLHNVTSFKLTQYNYSIDGLWTKILSEQCDMQ